MLKRIFVALIFISAFENLFAQTDSLQNRRINHEIGFQANPLFKQLINISNGSSSTITNPYLLSYSLAFQKCGLSLDAGVGYTYQTFQDKNSPANHQSKINDVFYRVGAGKRYNLGKRFEAEFAVDFAGSKQNDKTFSLTVVGFGGGSTDSTTSISNTAAYQVGGGLRGNLNFYISKKILIGTEANYYYFYTSNKQNVFITDVLTQGTFKQTTSSNSNTENSTMKLSLTLPAVLFLIVKF